MAFGRLWECSNADVSMAAFGRYLPFGRECN